MKGEKSAESVTGESPDPSCRIYRSCTHAQSGVNKRCCTDLKLQVTDIYFVINLFNLFKGGKCADFLVQNIKNTSRFRLK